jgi:NADPH:quinone reductase
MMIRGMTARCLLHHTYKVQAGDTILIHAAAGGVGLIMCQWAKHLGATVIGTVSSFCCNQCPVASAANFSGACGASFPRQTICMSGRSSRRSYR